MLAISWVLPDGTYLFPRVLSDVADAPYLGEAGILFNLTRQPAQGVAVKTGGSLPGFAIIILALQIGVGLALLFGAIRSHRLWRRNRESLIVRFARLQVAIWMCLMLATTVFLSIGKPFPGFLCLLVAQLFPRPVRLKPPPETAQTAV